MAKWKRNSLILFLVIWIPITIFLPVLSPVFNLMNPSGLYETGRASYNIDGRRELELTVWYPTEEIRKKKAPYFQDIEIIKEAISKKYHIPSSLLSYLKYIKTHSAEEVSLASKKNGFPVIILSPGFHGGGFLFTSLAEELSSHGFIIGVIDHTFSFKGTYLDEATSEILVTNQKQAINFLYELQEQEPLFKGKIDVTKIGIIGHSQGGTAAIQTLLSDNRVVAAVNMDGIMPSVKTSEDTLLIKTDESNQDTTGYLASIKGAKPMSFSDYYLYSPILSILDKVNHREDQRIISLLVVQFFNKSLYGEKSTIFDQGKIPYSRLEISNFKK